MRRIRSTLGAGVFLVVLYSIAVCGQANAGEVSHWKGRAVFEQKGCVECHSVFGSNGKGGPDLGKKKFYGTYLELATRMWNHFPKMYEKMQKTDVEFQEMNATEMEQLITYLLFIRYRGTPGDAYKGQKLLKKRCMPCHKFGENGGDIGPEFDKTTVYESSIQFIESMWNHGPDMMDVFSEHKIKRPVFKGDDVADILAAMRTYISTTKVPVGAFAMGDPAKGKELFREKGCVLCHSYRGDGGTLGPDFADIDLDDSAVQIAGKMWNHAPKMWEIMETENITVPVFEEGEMAHVLAYVYALKLEDEPGNPENGRRVIDKKGCLNCHSLQDQGHDRWYVESRRRDAGYATGRKTEMAEAQGERDGRLVRLSLPDDACDG
jgi:cytochrome c2